MDMSQTIAPKSDQLNADDLIAGPRTIKITRIVGHESDEQPVSVFFEGDKSKPYKPGLSMRRVMVAAWGTDSAEYIGRRMTLYNDAEVMFGGMKVGGIRISHMSDIQKEVRMPLTVKRGRKSEYVVRPLRDNDNEQVMEDARIAASSGTAAFTEFWNSDRGKKHRAFLKGRIDELRAIAKDADDRAKPLAQRLTQQEPESDAPPEDEWVFDPEAADPFTNAYTDGQTAFDEGRPESDAPRDDHKTWNNWRSGWSFQQQQKEKAKA